MTRHIGLIPVATVTHTEPFYVSKSIATLDYVSHGRAGWQARVSVTTHEAALFGRRNGSQIPLFDEAVEYVDVVRRLWDSWEDDAIIRDVTTGRYVDPDELHYVDFTGKYFSVKDRRSHCARRSASRWWPRWQVWGPRPVGLRPRRVATRRTRGSWVKWLLDFETDITFEIRPTQPGQRLLWLV
jgi:alkanesulfonate monooxygenase SsuD/methylene tetrahydromethanopterin reductase-like flavin-dependent oxidoreductase (luciferase family)